jgi:hypothetical protein
MTVYKWLVENWDIKKADIISMGIDPDKKYGETTLDELDRISCHLDVLISDLVD